MDLHIPLTVPKVAEKYYIKHMKTILRDTDNFFLFAGDQRVEHLNNDFFGEGIPLDDLDPEHLFRIASQANIGAFASQLGYIAKYGRDYPQIPYIVKVNSKTNIVKTSQEDPHSFAWVNVEQIVEFAKQSKLNIVGVGYTVYIGSEHESQMLHEAAQLIYKAHQHGLVVVLWMYPRGKAVLDEKDPHLIAGAVNVASGLGADFAKVNFPQTIGKDPYQALREATIAAGRTRVICAGGSTVSEEEFLDELHKQIHQSGTKGCATGRNVHQRPLAEAIAFCNAIDMIVNQGGTVEQAKALLVKKETQN